MVGKFINADEIYFIPADISLSTNLNAYCLNNPINNIDSSGLFGTPIQWVCAVIGGIVGWFFGDFVARSIGLFPGKWWQWQTAAYWTVRGLVVVGGAILGYVAGTKLLSIITKFVYNKGIAYSLPRVVQWFLGISSGGQLANELYQRYASHIFSYDHIRNGIRKLGSTDRQIFDRIFKVIQSCISQAQNGSNQIYTYINGYKVTIRFFFKDGSIKSIDAMMGWASRIIGKLMKKW